MDAFSHKLALVLKALAISRGRLAADLAVDKSVVGRWLSGRSLPSGENLAQLTRLIAARIPGFTGLDWDGDLAALSARLGLTHPGGDSATPRSRTLEAFAADRRMSKGALAAGRLAPELAGFWLNTVPVVGEPGQFLRSYAMLSESHGELLVESRLFGGRGTGWAVAAGSQIYMAVSFQEAFGLVFLIYNGADRPAAGLFDGVFSGCLPALGGIVVATPAVSERVAELSGDREADLQKLEELASSPEMVGAEAVSPAHLARLRAATEPTASQLALALPAMTSLARSHRPPRPPPHLKVVGP